MRPTDPIITTIARNDAPGAERSLNDKSLKALYPAGTFYPGTYQWQREDGKWPLTVFAGKHGAASTMVLLLERGALVPEEFLDEMLLSMCGAKPFETATRAVRLLVAAGADITTTSPILDGKRNGHNPLTLAALRGNRELIELLVEAGARLDSVDALGRTVLSALFRVFDAARLPCLETLLKAGVPLDVRNANDQLPCDLALERGSFEAVLMLHRFGSPLTGRLTAESVKRLAELADVARQIAMRQGPPSDLFDLLAIEQWELLASMAEAGMSLEIRHIYHGPLWTPVLDAVPLETQLRLLPTLDGSTAMTYAISRANRPGGLERLEGALALCDDLNAPTSSASVLGQALRANASEQALNMLLAHAADVQGANAGWTPAHDAVSNPDGLAWLKAHGADLDVHVEGRGTPLQIAVEKGSTDGVAFLIASGARQDVTDANGLTPLEAARKKKVKGLTTAFSPKKRARRKSKVEPAVTSIDPVALKAAYARDAGLEKTVEVFVDAFEKGKPKRSRADVEAWLVEGDVAALERLSGTALKKSGLMCIKSGYRTHDPEARARCLALLKAVLGEERLLEWITQHGSIELLDTYRVVELGRSLSKPASGEPSYRSSDRGLKEVAEALRGEPRFWELFRALTIGPTFRARAWDLCGALGAAERDDGGKTAVRWIDKVVVVRELSKHALHIFDDESEFEEFVSKLTEQSIRSGLRKTDTLLDAPGLVSIWINAVLDPRGTLDGKGGPLGWFDHDSFESTSGDVAASIRLFSRADTFADAAISALAKLGAPTQGHVDILYDVRLDTPPGERAYGWFLGSFEPDFEALVVRELRGKSIPFSIKRNRPALAAKVHEEVARRKAAEVAQQEAEVERRKAELAQDSSADDLLAALLSAGLDEMAWLWKESGARGRDVLGRSLLHLLVAAPKLDEALRVKLTRDLVAAGTDLDAVQLCVPATTALGVAVEKSRSSAYLSLLIELGADPNAGRSSPPLLIAVQSNRSQIDLLIAAGARVVGPVLSLAVEHHSTELVKSMLAAASHPPSTDDLAKAVERGKRDLVQLLLEAGADPNGQTFQGGGSALHRVKSVAMFDLLVDAGADINAECLGKPPLFSYISLASRNPGVGITLIRKALAAGASMRRPGPQPIHALAADYEGDAALVPLLAELGADLAALTQNGATAFDLAKSKAMKAALKAAKIAKGETMAKHLAKRLVSLAKSDTEAWAAAKTLAGASNSKFHAELLAPFAPIFEEKLRALGDPLASAFAALGATSEFVVVLLADGVNGETAAGKPLLHSLIENKKWAALRALLDADANPDVSSTEHSSGLSAYFQNTRPTFTQKHSTVDWDEEIIRMLATDTAVRKVDPNGETALSIALASRRDDGATVVIDMLLDHGADVALVLRSACCAGRLDLVRRAVEAGAPISDSALHSAVYSDATDVAAYLLEQGADPNALASVRPIILDIRNVEMLDLLLAHGADPFVATKSGQTLPHAIAKSTISGPQLIAMVERLQGLGMSLSVPDAQGETALGIIRMRVEPEVITRFC